MDQMTIEAMRDVERIRNNAAYERRNGLMTTDANMLAEHLVDALTRVRALEKFEARAADAEEELATANGEVATLETELDNLTKERDDARAELARLEGDIDEARAERANLDQNIGDWAVASGKAAHAISSLRSDVAIASARLDCGMEANERAAYKFCLRTDLPGGDCAACSAAKMQRENEGLKNTIEVIREERDRLLIEAQTKAARPAKIKRTKTVDDGAPSLFTLMPKQSTTAPKMKRKSRKPVH
jgi:DNA repair exonuclease SbcCD ATPase subunit